MKQQNPQDFPNIIFDLGGVIINIATHRTIDEFSQLIGDKPFDIKSRIESSDIFMELEKGTITEDEFYKHVCELLETKISWSDFEKAWNAMIGDLPVQRLEKLEEIAKNHRIFLLSNTNSIHLRRVAEVVKEAVSRDSIDQYFEKVYYSNHIGLRKPNTDIYDFVVKTHKLNPAETIFLDDNVHNLEGAIKAGLDVFHITEEKGIMDIF